MKQTLEKAFEYLSWIAVVLILFASFSMLTMLNTIKAQQTEIREQQKVGRKITLENNAYQRTLACLTSQNPNERSAEYVRNCYLQAEKNNGIELDRFGIGRE